MTAYRTTIVVGPSPPPVNGMSVATECVREMLDRNAYRVVHIDTADRRGLANVGKLDVMNVLLALRHGARFATLLLTNRDATVYVPIAQNTMGFLRDCLFLLPSRLLRCPTVIHLHGSAFGEFYRTSSRGMRALVRLALGNVARAVVLGESTAAIFDGIIPRDRIRVVPNGIEDLFASREPGEVGISEEPLTILYLSALTEDKGFLDLLDAAARLGEAGGSVKIKLAGEILNQRDRVRSAELAARLPSHVGVEFLGPVGLEEKIGLLKTADVFVFPPRQAEGLPYAILEAMCAGLPVVTTDSGCIPEVVRNGEEGVVIQRGRVDLLAGALERLRLNPRLREDMGRKARDRWRHEYSIDIWERRMLQVFCETQGFM